MLHQTPVAKIVLCEFAEIVGEGIALVEEHLEHSVARCERMARHVQYPRVWQGAADDAAVQIVKRQFVDEARQAAGARPRARQVLRAKRAEVQVCRRSDELAA